MTTIRKLPVHTPGPWSVPHFATAKDENDCDCTYVLTEGMFGAICSVHIDNGKNINDGGNDCPPADEAKANARLIAAAPDLLSALIQAHDTMLILSPNDLSRSQREAMDSARAVARAAIAKATAPEISGAKSLNANSGAHTAGPWTVTAHMLAALETIVAKNDLRDVPADMLETAARNALHECELVALDAIGKLCKHMGIRGDKRSADDLRNGAWRCKRCGFVGFWYGGPHDCENATTAVHRVAQDDGHAASQDSHRTAGNRCGNKDCWCNAPKAAL